MYFTNRYRTKTNSANTNNTNISKLNISDYKSIQFDISKCKLTPEFIVVYIRRVCFHWTGSIFTQRCWRCHPQVMINWPRLLPCATNSVHERVHVSLATPQTSATDPHPLNFDRWPPNPGRWPSGHRLIDSPKQWHQRILTSTWLIVYWN